jgi:hypothetical protein
LDLFEPPLTLPSVYCGNIFFWAHVLRHDSVVFDEGEFFVKQTYRNRMDIATESGISPLIIPLKKGKNSKQPMREVQISYAENWIGLHQKTIRSAYGNAAYFEHYAPELDFLFSFRDAWLIDWNFRWFDYLLSELSVASKKISRSPEYIPGEQAGNDLRDAMSPKQKTEIEHPAYYHVFFDRYEKPNNLSVLDLLLNEGLESLQVLKKTTLY